MTVEAPLSLHDGAVRAEWIDYNGHMNVAYYVLAFDHGSDALLDYLGLDAAYRERSACTAYVLETHVTYARELKLDDPFAISCQLLDWDAKRLHYFQCLHHGEQGFLAATSEILLMHIDTRITKGTPLPVFARRKLEQISDAHRDLPHPAQAGRIIGIRKKAAP